MACLCNIILHIERHIHSHKYILRRLHKNSYTHYIYIHIVHPYITYIYIYVIYILHIYTHIYALHIYTYCTSIYMLRAPKRSLSTLTQLQCVAACCSVLQRVAAWPQAHMQTQLHTQVQTQIGRASCRERV